MVAQNLLEGRKMKELLDLGFGLNSFLYFNQVNIIAHSEEPMNTMEYSGPLGTQEVRKN